MPSWRTASREVPRGHRRLHRRLAPRGPHQLRPHRGRLPLPADGPRRGRGQPRPANRRALGHQAHPVALGSPEHPAQRPRRAQGLLRLGHGGGRPARQPGPPGPQGPRPPHPRPAPHPHRDRGADGRQHGRPARAAGRSISACSPACARRRCGACAASTWPASGSCTSRRRSPRAGASGGCRCSPSWRTSSPTSSPAAPRRGCCPAAGRATRRSTRSGGRCRSR